MRARSPRFQYSFCFSQSTLDYAHSFTLEMCIVWCFKLYERLYAFHITLPIYKNVMKFYECNRQKIKRDKETDKVSTYNEVENIVVENNSRNRAKCLHFYCPV
ncbi:hypothetical protein AVEN_153357-1 [Araneus ventricosus]|uniref:Uncharacterized protein n=1 Tax=Araneus ventricosus TaxID=182803 RepID=A0A4Y2QNI3_ARAVE|nr:hypothetical protein AVEN_153357-1 [Araneus ventricosus]